MHVQQQRERELRQFAGDNDLDDIDDDDDNDGGASDTLIG